jgi:5-(carboxyamino)imidazole ribonucleotide synthase
VALRARGCVVEEVLPIDLELSVLVGRTPLGAMVSYPTALSYREHTAHLWSVLPADIAPQLDAKAQGLATFIASRLALEGLLAVEMFLLRDGQLVVNELVPCPHHTYLGAELACATGQHEQLVRAVCGLPLGSTRVVQPTAVVGVPGELWHGGKVPAFDEALRLPGVRLHIVDRREPRIGTAVGYLCATADSAEDAVGRALLARAELIPDRTRRAIMRRVPGVAALRRRGTTAL